MVYLFFLSSRRRHTRYWRDWSSDVCSSDLRWRGSRPSARRRRRDGGLLDERRYVVGARRHGGRGRARLPCPHPHPSARKERKSVVSGKSVDSGGRRIIRKKN